MTGAGKPTLVVALVVGLAASTARSAPVPSAPVEVPPANSSEPVPAEPGLEIEAMRAELRRAVSGLRLENGPVPYRGEVRWVRADLLSLDGSYGGLVTNVVDSQAIGTAELRVGSPARDNTNFFGSQSGVARLEVALEPAPAFGRRKLWLALDQSFRGATAGYTQKLNSLARLAGSEKQPADFTAGPEPVVELAPAMAREEFDRAGLGAMVAALSARFADAHGIDNGDVHFQVLRSHETAIDSDGMVLQWNRERAVLAVVADTRAADGMHLDHGLALHFQAVPATDDALLAEGEALVDRVLAELDELAKAPLIEEEYDGPVLFVGPAAAQILASTVATEASGIPSPMAENGRLSELEPAWQKRVGKIVMPPFVDLIDDPTLDAGFGSYRRDAEGIVPERIVLVRSGVLDHLLMTRTPNAKLSGSNGRARMSPSLESGPTISNLELASRRRGMSRGALERELLARAREDGYEFAYAIELLRDGSILGSVPRESAAAFAGTGKINLPLPARVYRIEAGGRRTLVRGAVLAPASMRVLRRIRAVGQRAHTETMRIPVGAFGGWNNGLAIGGVLSQTVDVQVTTPDLLVEGLELLVERGENERLPTLMHPLRRAPGPQEPHPDAAPREPDENPEAGGPPAAASPEPPAARAASAPSAGRSQPRRIAPRAARYEPGRGS